MCLKYMLRIWTKNLSLSSRFTLTVPFLDIKLFGLIAIKWILLVIVLAALFVAGFRYYRIRKAKNKRYQSKLHISELPQPGPRSVILGKIAETNRTAYFDVDQLMMHTLIAGSTGWW